MKLTIPSVAVKPDSPSFAGMMTEILRYLAGINGGGLTARENITTVALTAQLKNGVPVKIGHNLKNPPTLVQLTSGRVTCVSIYNIGNSDFTVAAKLLSTRTLAIESSFTDRMEVEDATLFYVDDTIIIGDKQRTITNIQDRLLTLNKNILLESAVPVTLAGETCAFFLM